MVVIEFAVKGYYWWRLKGSHIVNYEDTLEKITSERLACEEFEKFRVVQDAKFESDFDKSVKTVLSKQ